MFKAFDKANGSRLISLPYSFYSYSPFQVFGHSHFGTSVARFLPSILFFGFNVDVDGVLVYPINECTQNRNIKAEHEPLAVLDKFFKHKKHRRKSEVHQAIEHRSKKDGIPQSVVVAFNPIQKFHLCLKLAGHQGLEP